MFSKITKSFALAAAALTISTQVVAPAPAESRNWRNSNFARVNGYRRPGVYQRHPIISRTLTGTAIGAATGATVGLISGRGRVGKGALIGAGVGTAAGFGYGLYRNHQYNRGYF